MSFLASCNLPSTVVKYKIKITRFVQQQLMLLVLRPGNGPSAFKLNYKSHPQSLNLISATTMDRELIDIPVLGFCGIYKKSCNIIFSFKKIFSNITLALILPLTFILLAQYSISDLIFSKTDNDELTLIKTLSGRQTNSIKDKISSQRALFWVYKAAYSLLVIILDLFCIAAVVYTVACIYTAKLITFKKVLSVVPKLWKRQAVTFFWYFIILVGCTTVLVLISLLWVLTLGNSTVGSILIIISAILYLIGLVYINVIWQLASVISVLEEVYGIKAMKKSRTLIKAKLIVAVVIYLIMDVCLYFAESLFESFVVHADLLAVGFRVLIGVVCVVLVLIIILYNLVVQTVIYFACKAVHQETIEKSSLAQHLEGFLAGNDPHMRREVQLEESNV